MKNNFNKLIKIVRLSLISLIFCLLAMLINKKGLSVDSTVIKWSEGTVLVTEYYHISD